MRKVFICENCFDEVSDSSRFCSHCGLQFDQGAPDIKVKNPGILEIPEGAFNEWGVGKLVKHFISLAKKKGKAAVMRAVVNLERWNKNDDPDIAKKARSVINALKESTDWEAL